MPNPSYDDRDPRCLVGSSGLSFLAGPAADVQQQVRQAARHREREHYALDVESFVGYKWSWWKLPLALLALVGSGGLVLFFRHSAFLAIVLCLTTCDLHSAPYVLVALTSKRYRLARVKQFTVDSPVHLANPAQPSEKDQKGLHAGHAVRLISAFYSRFIYSPDAGTYVPLPEVPHEITAQLVHSADWLQQRQSTAAEKRQPASDLVQTFSALKWDRPARRSLYGSNRRPVLLASVFEQICTKVFSPTCLYLYACLAFQGYFYRYWVWAAMVGGVTIAMQCANIAQVYYNNRALAKLTRYVCNVEVLQDGQLRTIVSTELVPGDVVVVKQGRVPCDMVLLWGRAIVDEAMLTGETVPIRKSPFLSAHAGLAYRPDVHSPCTLQSGTEVLQAWTQNPKDMVIAMVSRTRFFTAEGQLLAAMAAPRKNRDPHFSSDVVAYVAAATTLGFVSWIPAVATAQKWGSSATDVLLSAANNMTIVMPPALVTCLAIATAFSIYRLYLRCIVVSDVGRINLAGHINMVLFDKTGTITEASMKFRGILPVHGERMGSLQVAHTDWSPATRLLLATCHSLISIEEQLMGEDLDRQPFLAMGCAFVGPDLVTLPNVPQGAVADQLPPSAEEEGMEDMDMPDEGQWLSIIRQFEFSSSRQRNVVVIKTLDSEEYLVNAKGSPEAILKMVDPASVPRNFDKVLNDYTTQGFRMMAIATGRLPRSTTPEEVVAQSQAEIEAGANLQLLGLCVIVNKLHSQSKGTLKRLHNRAQMRSIMVTGDHVITAISVARQVGMMYERRPVCIVDAAEISELFDTRDLVFTCVYTQPKRMVPVTLDEAMVSIAAGECQCAITGSGFVEMLRLGDPDLIEVVLQNLTVAARMLPNHKQDLVALLGSGIEAGRYSHEHLRGLGHFVGFCGDGLNDMAALKAAHVGISLSSGEVNLAAPFTARLRNVGSMVAMLLEGRCSLAVTYLLFQYMTIYGLNEAVLTNVLAVWGLAPSNNQYIAMDILFVFVITTLAAKSVPEESLTREGPPRRLLAHANVLPCLVQIVVATATQLGAIRLLQLQPWYHPADVANNPDLLSSCEAVEVTVLLLVSLGHLITPMLILHRHMRPHVRPLPSNRLLCAWLLACSVITAYFTLHSQPHAFTNRFCVLTLPAHFRPQLLAYIVASGVLSALADSLLRCVLQRLELTAGHSTHSGLSGIWRSASATTTSAAQRRKSSQSAISQMKRRELTVKPSAFEQYRRRSMQGMQAQRSMALTRQLLGSPRSCPAGAAALGSGLEDLGSRPVGREARVRISGELSYTKWERYAPMREPSFDASVANTRRQRSTMPGDSGDGSQAAADRLSHELMHDPWDVGRTIAEPTPGAEDMSEPACETSSQAGQTNTDAVLAAESDQQHVAGVSTSLQQHGRVAQDRTAAADHVWIGMPGIGGADLHDQREQHAWGQLSPPSQQPSLKSFRTATVDSEPGSEDGSLRCHRISIQSADASNSISRGHSGIDGSLLRLPGRRSVP